MTIRVLDLFSGAAGGWSLGLAHAGYRTVAACEIDPWRRAVFAATHPGCLTYADIRELTAERLRADLGYLPDVVVGSPPCQDISAANCKGEGITDDHLFWEWARLVFEVRPLWCAAENSPRARADGIDGILDALDQAGYATWACVVGADNVGANHRRKRLWLVAADSERIELWQQPGRGGGAYRRGAAVAGEHDRDATCVRCDRWRSSETTGWPRSITSGDAQGHDAGDAAVVERLRLGGTFAGRAAEPAQAGLRPHCANDGEELPAALRDIGRAWPHWNGGLAGLAAACAAAGFGAVDDGSDAGLPAGLRNRAIAALGDAVVPQIPELIGRAIMEASA